MTEGQPQQECPPPRTREAVNCWLRKWGRDAAVDGKEPLTGEDVDRLIQANGGTAQGLDLSGRDMQGLIFRGALLLGQSGRAANLQGANLSSASLQGAYLSGANVQGADLRRAKLQGADLISANLRHADLSRADLQGAHLMSANLLGADLRHAILDGADFEGSIRGQWTNMQGVRLFGARITETTRLRRVLWGAKMTLGDEVDQRWGECLDPYRDLKQWHQRAGDYDTAGEFNHREWVCRRKQAQREFVESCHKTKNPWRLSKSLLKARWSALAHALVLAFYEQLFGYGERPWRVVRAAVAVVLGLAAAYYYFGTFVQPVGFIDALYFSAVSFSALGYGSWAPEPQGWARYMGVAESFLGVFTIALFLVTFTRKMVR